MGIKYLPKLTTVSICLALVALPFSAQDTPPAASNPGIKLNFPDNVELRVLLDFVSKRLNVNIIYDDKMASKRITIKAPAAIPPESLMGLLESSLKMNGLALAEGEEKGWYRVVQSQELPSVSKSPKEVDNLKQPPRASVPVTRVFSLTHTDAQRADQVVKPFLTKPGGNSIVLNEHRILIVTDFAGNLKRLEEMVQLVDKPGQPVELRFIPVKNMEATQLSQQLTQLITSKAQVQGKTKTQSPQILSIPDDRTNQLALIATPDALAEALSLIESLDITLGMSTKIYRFKLASPDRVDRLVKQLIGELKAKRYYQSAIDAEARMLVVNATSDIHQTIDTLLADIDMPIEEGQNPIRFYKLENATALEVLDIIRSLEGQQGFEQVAWPDSGTNPTTGNPDPGNPGTNPTAGTNSNPGNTANPATANPAANNPGPNINQNTASQARTASTQSMTAYYGDNPVRVTADPNTNTIIVVGSPEVQRIYEHLINKLDQRRAQVLIEAKIITLDTSNGFNLSVEIGSSKEFDTDERVVNLSSFGVNTANANGRISLQPQLGFNGALVSADIADIVVQALKTSGRSRVMSAPRILVNDNATGTLESISEAPFQSVNASDTVATTSFGGFASAGTTIAVTPHISQGDYLHLEYKVDLNSFDGDGTATLPPPRQTNSLESEVTIPDGYTIIVGGLTRKDIEESIQRVPILGELPILEWLGSSRSETERDTTLFVFIRAVILRDDQFRDLKGLSDQDNLKADADDNSPQSKPILMK